MQLEQITGYQSSATQERQTTYFVFGDLRNLGAICLYDAASERNLYSKYIDEIIRADEHKPFGEHLNYEVKLNLQGSKLGRQANLTNVHLPLSPPSIKIGS